MEIPNALTRSLDMSVTPFGTGIACAPSGNGALLCRNPTEVRARALLYANCVRDARHDVRPIVVLSGAMVNAITADDPHGVRGPRSSRRR
jgi:hypothetical protein